MRKSAVESSRTETGRIKHWVAGHKGRKLTCFSGKESLFSENRQDSYAEFSLLDPALPRGPELIGTQYGSL